MLGKLLKYDLKWVFKLLIVFYVLTIFFALLGRGFGLIENSTIFDFVSKFCFGIAVSLSISGLVNNIMRLWARYVNNFYKDESYLTHTLPVEKRDIYLSKVLCGFITMSCTIVIALVNLVICYSWDSLSKFVKMIVPDNYLVVVLCLIVLVLEVFFLLFVGNFGITIGHRNNDNKMVMSIVVAFGAYMISSTISLIVLLICGLFNNDLMKLFTSNNTVLDAGVLKFTLVVALILYLIYITICNVVSYKLLAKGVNVD